MVEALLPGPLTLVLPNPEHRFPWLNVERPDTIGVRVPALVAPGAEVLEAIVVPRRDEREPARRPRPPRASRRCRAELPRGGRGRRRREVGCPASRRPSIDVTGERAGDPARGGAAWPALVRSARNVLRIANRIPTTA